MRMGRYLMMQRLLCFLTTMYLIILSCPLALDEKKGHYNISYSSSAFSNDFSSNFNNKGITGIESEVIGNADF